ncbi:ATP-binding protein [Streptomyces sp. CB01881]|uniref:ATP-binding protein n=1 Tax=Streptomyces sp. CB01881 TaxID=2078691 RepID=UPI000CDBFF4A|nr:ATP-binding protein [Streptomyces sp. CB01881]AUY51435.1 ATP-binding protein [Streptomyces sp. CB01881]TYC74828.1 ATP-binding protein [Streptomyces sp. CB01881]
MSDSPLNPVPIARARVVLLSGPSGSGKSSLAERSGLPVLQLDDFYKDGDDPTLPLLPDGAVDWDSPLAWHRDQAVAAIRSLYETGRADVPVYSIPDNGRVSTRVLDLAGAPAFIAEGIFAAEITSDCAAEGVLGDALCLRNGALTTAWRRLRRDVREGRKSLPVLLRRGWRLMRAERSIVGRQMGLGAHPCTGAEADRRIRAAASRELSAV